MSEDLWGPTFLCDDCKAEVRWEDLDAHGCPEFQRWLDQEISKHEDRLTLLRACRGQKRTVDYTKTTPRQVAGRDIDRYDAKIGPFFVGAQDNGEGWWNWWIASAAQGPAAGEHHIVDSGGTMSWEVARRDIENALRDIAEGVLEELQ